HLRFREKNLRIRPAGSNLGKLLNCGLMGFRSFLARPFAALIASETKRWSERPGYYQQETFRRLIRDAGHTAFGKDHGFDGIRTHEEFRQQVPVRAYRSEEHTS